MTQQSAWNTLMDADPEAPFWVVWNPQGQSPTFRHPSQQVATKEAERLARLNPKQRFHVLEAKGCCIFDPQPVTWVKVDPDWIPF